MGTRLSPTGISCIPECITKSHSWVNPSETEQCGQRVQTQSSKIAQWQLYIGVTVNWLLLWSDNRVTHFIAHLCSVVWQQSDSLHCTSVQCSMTTVYRTLAELRDLQLTPGFTARHLTTQMRWNSMSNNAKQWAFMRFVADTGDFAYYLCCYAEMLYCVFGPLLQRCVPWLTANSLQFN